MPDPYSTLGVKREASADEIKRAYRKLAKTWHPDHNKDNPKAAARFSEINSAYEIIGDEAKRKSFDRGEIDGDGKPRFTGNPFEGAGAGAGGPSGFRFDFGTSGPFGGARGGDPRDMFSDLFRKFETGGPDPFAGQARGGGGRGSVPAGEDIALDAVVPLETISMGGTIRVTLPDARSLEVKVPAGAANGSTMRLKGQGRTSPFGGPNGDALVTLRYQRHARFIVDGPDLRIAVPLPIRDAVLGGPVRVPTLDGEVELTVPAFTSGGKTLRLKGKGLPSKERQGDLYVTFDIDLGAPDAEMEGFFRRRKG